jgi:hypothetical protein
MSSWAAAADFVPDAIDGGRTDPVLLREIVVQGGIGLGPSGWR